MGVSHDHAEKCLMSCDVFGRAINTHTDVIAVKVEQRGDSAESVLVLFVCIISSLKCHLWPLFNPEHAFVCAYSLQSDYFIVEY